MNLSIKRSNKAGIKPNVNQFPDSNTVIWNQADGKLWGLRVDGGGNKMVVLIGGGVNTIGEVHSRLHQVDSADDHAPVEGEKIGKWLRMSPETGYPLLAPLVHVGTSAPGYAIEGDIWFDTSEDV